MDKPSRDPALLAAATVTRIHPERAVLDPLAEMDVESAELFLLSLASEATDGPRAAYLLGLAEGHLLNLVGVLRRVAR